MSKVFVWITQSIMFSVPDYSATESFLNPRLGPWTVVLYLHRKPILEAVLKAAPFLQGDLLDVGCGNKPYEPVLNCSRHIGIDVPSSQHDRTKFDFTYDGTRFPFENAKFDSVLCTEVLEHSREPRQVVTEIARVLKPGGYALLAAPMFFHHHEEPYDFQRFTRYGMEELAAQAGLELVWIQPRGGAYAATLAAVYLGLSQALSRRPFVDVLLWLLWPMAVSVVWMDRKRLHPCHSLGWQMLVCKPTTGEGQIAA
jgi:SAM-dependent methyltransferase